MRATLEFVLPEEELEFDCASKAVDWRNVVFELNEYIVKRIKHTENYDEVVGLELAQEQLWHLVNEKDLCLRA
jgi:uncharacterized circularly permuted ATP-grasp superfamily protein